MSQNHIKIDGDRPGLADDDRPEQIEHAVDPDKVEKVAAGPDKLLGRR